MLKRIAAFFLLSTWVFAVPGMTTQSQSTQTVDEFFRRFTDEWMRGNPNAATAARYFTGS